MAGKLRNWRKKARSFSTEPRLLKTLCGSVSRSQEFKNEISKFVKKIEQL